MSVESFQHFSWNIVEKDTCSKARFPLGDFFRVKRLFPLSASHLLMWYATPIKEKVASREKSRLVKNGLKPSSQSHHHSHHSLLQFFTTITLPLTTTTIINMHYYHSPPTSPFTTTTTITFITTTIITTHHHQPLNHHPYHYTTTIIIAIHHPNYHYINSSPQSSSHSQALHSPCFKYTITVTPTNHHLLDITIINSLSPPLSPPWHLSDMTIIITTIITTISSNSFGYHYYHHHYHYHHKSPPLSPSFRYHYYYFIITTIYYHNYYPNLSDMTIIITTTITTISPSFRYHYYQLTMTTITILSSQPPPSPSSLMKWSYMKTSFASQHKQIYTILYTVPFKSHMTIVVSFEQDMMNLPVADTPTLIISALCCWGKSNSPVIVLPVPSGFFWTLNTLKVFPLARAEMNALMDWKKKKFWHPFIAVFVLLLSFSESSLNNITKINMHNYPPHLPVVTMQIYLNPFLILVALSLWCNSVQQFFLALSI